MTFGLVVARWAHVAPPRGLFHVVGAIVALALTLLSARRARGTIEPDHRVGLEKLALRVTSCLRPSGCWQGCTWGLLKPIPRKTGANVLTVRQLIVFSIS